MVSVLIPADTIAIGSLPHWTAAGCAGCIMVSTRTGKHKTTCSLVQYIKLVGQRLGLGGIEHVRGIKEVALQQRRVDVQWRQHCGHTCTQRALNAGPAPTTTRPCCISKMIAAGHSMPTFLSQSAWGWRKRSCRQWWPRPSHYHETATGKGPYDTILL